MIRCIFFIAIFMPAVTYAQSRGTVEVIKDARIDTLAAKRSALINRHSATAPVYYTSALGYRVQIFNGSVRKEAYDTQAVFRNNYPDIHTYISYTAPNFKVRAGDFRTRMEAEKLMTELRGKFTSLFIIREKINPTKADTPND